MTKGFLMPIEERRIRMHKASKILGSMLPVRFDKAVATISLALGLREMKVQEYLRIIINANNLVVAEGVIQGEMLKEEGVESANVRV